METGTKLAFGVEPSSRAYRLRLARYVGLAEAVSDWLDARPSPSARRYALVDIGVGSGRTLRYLEAAGVADRLDLHGIDTSTERLSGIYRPERWRLCRADAESGLPYPDASMDVCVCEQVVEHLFEPQRLVAEAARVLRAGGLLVLGAPIRPPGWARLRGLYQDARARLGVEGHHVQSFTAATLTSLVEGAGLDVRDQRGFRLASGGVLRGLEETEWWYEFNRSLGRSFPAACGELQILATKPG